MYTSLCTDMYDFSAIFCLPKNGQMTIFSTLCELYSDIVPLKEESSKQHFTLPVERAPNTYIVRFWVMMVISTMKVSRGFIILIFRKLDNVHEAVVTYNRIVVPLIVQ